MKVRLVNQYRSYRRGDVIEVSARMADELVRQRLAVVETQSDFLPAETREAAVAARVNVRTADRK
jgi:hypothetical protein